MSESVPDDHDTVLEVKDLHTYFFNRRGVTKAVDGISFSLKEGENPGLVGESRNPRLLLSCSGSCKAEANLV